MTRRAGLLSVIGAFLALAFLAASSEIAGTPQGRKSGLRTAQARAVPGQLLVKFKDDPKGLTAEAARSRAEFRQGLARIKHLRLTGVDVYRTTGPVETVLKTLAKSPNVVYAEPDYLVQIDASLPNDPSFGLLWGMNNTGQSGGTVDADIDAPEAWDLSTGSSDVIVGVIDSGVAYTHPDLAANMWMNPGEIAGNGVDDDGNGYVDDVHGINSINGSGDPMDDNNHGTHCAGTIAAVGNNGVGVAGVCWTARIMALKFLTAAGSGSNSNAVECIEYAISKGAHILSNSWGNYNYGQALKDAIDAARAAGILFVAAAGNDGFDNDGPTPHYPSSYDCPNIVAVAATDRNDALSVWSSTTASNYGLRSVDVAAPGTSIYSTIANGTCGTMSGTSMATPHVAGLAALIKSFNFSWDWMEIKNRILAGTDPLPSLQGKVLTGGRINAYNALTMADVESFDLEVDSLPTAGAEITMSPADLDGQASGTTAFTRRFAPYTSVTLTAAAAHESLDFGFWTLDGTLFSREPSITLPMDFDHAVKAFYPVPIGEALDNGSLQVLTGGEQQGFFGQNSVSYAGGDAAQSFRIGDGQSGYLQTTVHGPGSLSFYWKVSSESDYDFLTFSVDGEAVSSISGEVDWARVDHSLGAGPHLLQWIYAKDESVAAGSDCGWVDALQFDGTGATLAQALDQGMVTWTTGGVGGWFYETASTQYDGDAAQSSDLADNQETTLETTVTGPASLSFHWKVSSEAGWDFLRFYIDGVPQSQISGEVDWTPMDYSLGAGVHVLRWAYAKDVALSSGSDCGWVDHVGLGLSSTHVLSLTKGGGGDGGIKVGDDPVAHAIPYTESFVAGAAVGLQAVPDAGDFFTGWSGDLISATNPTTVTMDADKSIVAAFEPITVQNLTVISPNGGENWNPSSTHDITWTHAGRGGLMTIDLYKGGLLQKTLGTTEAADDLFAWTIDPGQTAGTDYRIAISQGTVNDQSDTDFAISPVAKKVDFDGDGQEDILWRYCGTGDYQGLILTWLMGQSGQAEATIAARPMTAGAKSIVLGTASGNDVLDGVTARSPQASGPSLNPRSILNGNKARFQRPKLSLKTPMRTARSLPARNRRGRTEKDLKIIPVRKEATLQAAPGSGEAQIASIIMNQEVIISQVSDLGWEVAGAGDFNGDQKTDILWRNYGAGPYQGLNDIWFMDGTSFAGESVFSLIPDLNWRIDGTGDFNGDGETDIFWRYYGTGDYQGLNVIWFMNDSTFQSEAVFSLVLDTDWRIAGTGDFNNDGETDILWRYYGSGAYQGLNDIWFMNDWTFQSEAVFSQILDTAWDIAGTGDFNADGNVDILWRYYGAGPYQGLNDIWYMNGTQFVSEEVFSVIPDTNWRIVNR